MHSWAHFVALVGRLEHGLGALEGAERARAARDLFTYLHLPIVGGIILAALGIEQALAHLESGRVGTLGSWALGGGLARAVGEWQLRIAAPATGGYGGGSAPWHCW
jgi:low temperature requirement protein LtrA